MLKKTKKLHFLTPLYLTVFVLYSFAGYTFAQEQQTGQPEIIVQQAISISDISLESEKLGQRIFKLRTILEPSKKIKEVDSLLLKTSVEINLQRDSLFTDLKEMTQRSLKVKNVEWNNYKLNLKSYQSVLSARLADVNKTNKELTDEIKKWELTKQSLSERKDSEEIYSSLDNVIVTLHEIMDISLVRLDSIFIIQKGLTNLILTVDEVISEINRMELQLQKDYFVFDSPSLWNYNKIDSLSNDTTKLSTSIQSGMHENFAPLSEFLSQNVKTVIFQIIFLLMILTLLLLEKRKWRKESHELTNEVEKEAKIILRHPIASTLVVGLIISLFFYHSIIPVFSEIHFLIILASTTFLLPRLTTKRFNIFLLLLFVVYIIQSLTLYLNPQSFLVRILLLFDTVVLFVAMIYGQIEMRLKPKQFLGIKKLFKLVVPVYMLFMIIAVFANLLGMVSLSRFLIKGVLSSTALGLVVFLSVKVITSIFLLFFKLRSSSNTQALSTITIVAQKRIKPILLFFGLLVWLIFSLMGFEIYEYLVEYVKEMLLINWPIGKMTISLGGILSFSGIFLVTILLARLGAAIFEDEWMINILPRGIAPAISLLLRITLITVGLYIGLSAAGLDLSRLGFIVGALGVGIGFGLQNVVLNFIAGLILAFERPINLGDAIEVDQEFGVVTNIGIRSSNIKTYSGSEAIIPNGDLISKKVINWTLSNRDRRTKVLMKTSASADPKMVIELFNSIAAKHPLVFKDRKPITLFHGYNEDGNLDFVLHYWTSFSDTLITDNDIALEIFSSLKENGIQAPVPMRRIISDD
jgi:potassium efflux system protein